MSDINLKEEHFIKSRLIDLANTAYEKSIYTYSDFLNINEINILNNIKNQLPPVKVSLSGGNHYAERQIAVFEPIEIYYEQNLPISILKIAPLNSKYADQLSHRDFLGAILNLGISRSKIGDIFIKNNIAYLYCISDFSDYICDNLFKIKHTQVSVSMCEENFSVAPEFREIQGTIGNIRLDSLISTAFSTSRNSIISYIENGKVFVNGKCITSNGYTPKEGDIISVRQKGRFIYKEFIKTTKKGRNLIKILLYI